jgi:hypothetical protein
MTLTTKNGTKKFVETKRSFVSPKKKKEQGNYCEEKVCEYNGMGRKH